MLSIALPGHIALTISIRGAWSQPPDSNRDPRTYRVLTLSIMLRWRGPSPRDESHRAGSYWSLRRELHPDRWVTEPLFYLLYYAGGYATVCGTHTLVGCPGNAPGNANL